MARAAFVRSLFAAAAAAAVSAALAPAALAQGIVLPRERERWPRPEPLPIVERPVPLEVRSLAIDVEIRGRVATTRMDQVFWNPSDRELEGTYLFPLPDGAAVEKLLQKLLTTLVLICLIRAYANQVARSLRSRVARTVSSTAMSRVTWKESHESLWS